MAYFVPASAGFQTSVGDPTSERYWKILIDVDDDDVLEDVTSLLDNNAVKGGGKRGGTFGEAVSNKYAITLRNTGGTYSEGDWAGAICEIQAKCGSGNEYITIFTGYIDEMGIKRVRTTLNDDRIVVNMVDYTKLRALKRKTDYYALINFKIRDNSIKSQSLFHKLCYDMGLSDSDISSDGATINYTKDYLPLDGNSTPWQELQNLAAAYLGLLTFRYDGKLLLRSRFETGWSNPSSEWTFDDDNIHSLSMDGGKIVCNKAFTEFNVYQALDAGRVIHKCLLLYNYVYEYNEITVDNNEYWPGGTVEGDVATLEFVDPKTNEKFDLASSVITPTIGTYGSGSDIECQGGLLTLHSFNGTAGTDPSLTTQQPDGAQIILKNTSGGTVTIRKLEIRGTPLRILAKQKVEDIEAGLQDYEYQEKNLPGKYMVNDSQAFETCQWWVLYGKQRRKRFNIITDWIPQIQEGAVVTLDSTALGINDEFIVDAFTHDSSGPMGSWKTKITLIEDMDYTPSGTPVGKATYSGNAAPEQIDIMEDDIAERPTYSEIQDGYNQGGGTTSPDTPTIQIVEAVGVGGLAIIWDKQLDLTNFDRYEVQVSDDDTNWYSLKFDGTDWKDTLNGDTDIDGEFLVHTAIPHTGTTEDPQGRTLYYRVRRVTKAAAQSGWSASVSGTTNTVDNGDIAANSVYANNLVAGIISALVAQIDNYLEIGGDGFIGKTYGDTSGYQEAGLSDLEGTLETGLSTSTQYYFKLNVDGGGESEYDITTGSDTTYNAVIQLMNDALIDAGALFGIKSGDLRCTSLSTGASSSIALSTASLSGTSLFDTLTGFSAFDSAVAGATAAVAYGDTRSRLYEDSIIMEMWDETAWGTFIKIGGNYNNLPFPYFQGLGLMPVGIESDTETIIVGERITTSGSPLLFDFDTNFSDQNGDSPLTISNANNSGAYYKFGEGCLEGTADSGTVEDTDDFLSDMGTYSHFYSTWLRIQEFEEANLPMFGLAEENGNTAEGLTPQAIESLGALRYPCLCHLNHNTVALIYQDGSDAIVRIGTYSNDNTISWGAKQTVQASVFGNYKLGIDALNESKIVVTYCKRPGSYLNIYCKIGVISGSTVTFGSESTICEDTTPTSMTGHSFVTRMKDERFVVLYASGSNELSCMIGNVSGATTIALGSKYVISSTTGCEQYDIEWVTDIKFVAFYRQDNTNYYLAGRAGNVSNDDEITYETETVISSTFGVLEAHASRMNDVYIAVSFVKRTGADLYVTGVYGFSGSLSTFTPVDSGSNADDASMAIGGWDNYNTARGMLVFNEYTGSNYTYGLPFTITTGGTISFGTLSSDLDSGHSSGGLTTTWRNRFVYTFVHVSTIGNMRDVVVGVDRRHYFGFEYVKDWYTQTNKLYFFFHIWDTSKISIEIPVDSSATAQEWYNVTFKFDQPSDNFYILANGTGISIIDTSTYTFNSINLGFYVKLRTDDRIDDLYLDPQNTISSTYFNTHYTKNIKWVPTWGFEEGEDVLIIAKESGTAYGKVYVRGHMVIDQRLAIGTTNLNTSWDSAYYSIQLDIATIASTVGRALYISTEGYYYSGWKYIEDGNNRVLQLEMNPSTGFLFKYVYDANHSAGDAMSTFTYRFKIHYLNDYIGIGGYAGGSDRDCRFYFSSDSYWEWNETDDAVFFVTHFKIDCTDDAIGIGGYAGGSNRDCYFYFATDHYFFWDEDGGYDSLGWLEFTRPLVIKNGTDVDESNSGSGYFIIGDPTSSHITIDNNEIMAKLNGTSSDTTLYLQSDSGYLESDRVYEVSVTGRDVYVSSTGRLGYLSSSGKYKKNVRSLDKESQKIFDLKPVLFDWNKKKFPEGSFFEHDFDYGLIVEDVEKILPGLISYHYKKTRKKKKIVKLERKEPETILYRKLIPLILNEVIKLREEINILKGDNQS